MAESRVYDHIVGLGYDCRLAYNLRRTFGFTVAYPFDWWVTPLAALAAFLRDPSVERLYDPEHLRPSLVKDRLYSIRNAHYDIELHHEFPRGKDSAVTSAWTQHIQPARARTQYLMDRFLGLKPGSRVLFVRATKKAEGRELGPSFRPLIGEVRQALDGLFPRVEADLLLIDPVEMIKAPRIANLRVGDPNKAEWRGTPELWTKQLLGAGIVWGGVRAASTVDADPVADNHLPIGASG